MDAQGRAATFTGGSCLDWAGGRTGDGYAAQGNILVSHETVDAVAEAYEDSVGPLAKRLLVALTAAQHAGGDRRGQQSAALLVVRDRGGYGGCNDRMVDLRVDYHAMPIAELERLYTLHQLLFGEMPEHEWVTVDDTLASEMRERLAALGYFQGKLEDAFAAWVAAENLEERSRGNERVDPAVLAELRKSR